MNKIIWEIPDFTEELPELERYLGQTKNKKEFFNSIEEILTYFSKGYLTTEINLNVEIQNFDHLLLDKYNSDLLTKKELLTIFKLKGKAVDIICDVFTNGGRLKAIVLLNVGNRYYELISGNTRLMFSNMFNIDPLFFIIDI